MATRLGAAARQTCSWGAASARDQRARTKPRKAGHGSAPNLEAASRRHRHRRLHVDGQRRDGERDASTRLARAEGHAARHTGRRRQARGGDWIRSLGGWGRVGERDAGATQESRELRRDQQRTPSTMPFFHHAPRASPGRRAWRSSSTSSSLTLQRSEARGGVWAIRAPASPGRAAADFVACAADDASWAPGFASKRRDRGVGRGLARLEASSGA